jgi:para-aminobenzoate synthetase/4-amino-4-deoxychorismate lyase
LHVKIENGKTLEVSKDFFALFPRPKQNSVLIFSELIKITYEPEEQKQKDEFGQVYLLDFESENWKIATFAKINLIRYEVFLELVSKCINMPVCYEKKDIIVKANSYQDDVLKIQEEIRKGNVYQVNLTTGHQFSIPPELPLFSSWLKLYTKQVSNQSSFISLPGIKVASLSPELFFSVKKSTITSEPMKGTSGVSTAQVKSMQTSEKEKAENAMITDMIRNDIARVSEFGSVSVTKPFFTTSYQTISQMSTQIKANLRPGTGLVEVLKALHPPGSVTGAPKIASLALIHNLEKKSRELYTGAAGYTLPSGRAQFNVLIRTLVQTQPGLVSYGSGAGITIDSDPVSEYHEMLKKVNVLFDVEEDLCLETFRCTNKKIYWLEAHLARLTCSYYHLFKQELPIDTKTKLLNFVQRCPGQRGILRLRIKPGLFSLNWHPHNYKSGKNYVSIADSKLSSQWGWLKIKSTRRQLYTTYQYLALKNDLADYLFFNEMENLCEGSISTIFIKRGNYYVTPPLKNGLLNGIFRQKLLDRFPSLFKEEQVTLKEFKQEKSCVLGNAARGFRRAYVR